MTSNGKCYGKTVRLRATKTATARRVGSWAMAAMAAASFAAGCGGDKPTTTTPPPQVGTLTFWQDVAPVFQDKCIKCHQKGGIAPFRLDTFADAKLHADAALLQVKNGTMPPFLAKHDGTCGELHDEDTLSEDQVSIIEKWVTGGRLEGTPIDLTQAVPPVLTGAVDVATPAFSPVPSGGQLAEFDEYRCFLVDAPTARDAYLTGYDVSPGEPSIVHHLLGFVVDPSAKGQGTTTQTNGEIMAALDAESPDRDGWPCFGAAGDNVNVSAVPVTWAPGQGIVSFPEGTGVPLRATDKLVLQVHYNLAVQGSAGKTDTTRVHLRLADKVTRQLAFLLPDPFLASLDGGMPDTLPPGQPRAEYTWTLTGRELGLSRFPSVDLVAVMPHMHGRGVSQVVRAGTGGSLNCISEIDRWDFHWQKFYSYRSPPRLTPDTQLRVTCGYDTSADTAAVLPGWGTRNEMCLTVLMVELPATATP